MEFDIRIRCKREDRDYVRQSLRLVQNKINSAWSCEETMDQRTGTNYKFGFYVRHKHLSRVLETLKNEVNLGTNMIITIESWG